MSADAAGFKVLVLSPIASHPQDYGNRNRILQMTQYFKELGYEIHFLLYPIEPDWSRGIPPSAREMREAWDSFTIVPPSRPLHQPSIGEHHEIDEWWDPVIGNYLDWLFKRQFFDVMLVNYTYFSKAFEHAPRGTVKVLEMHDLFSGRKEMFAANGIGPDFFYTVAEQERIAFDRADIVIAIKDGEAKIVREMTDKPVAVSVPFYMTARPSRLRPERLLPDEDLRIGFLGANNLVNVVNMRHFLERFAKAQQIYIPNLKLLVAGNVCIQLPASTPGVTLLGRVENIQDFYDEIDVVVAPLMFSTGIKIKVGEALSFGKPVVATANGFDGYLPTDRFHTLKSYDEACRALVALAYDRERLKILESRSAMAAKLAHRSNADGCRTLANTVRRLSRMVVLVTDQPINGAGTGQQERLAQWIQMFAWSGRATVLYVGDSPLKGATREDLSLVTLVDLSGEPAKAEAAIAALETFDKTHNIVELAISAEGGLGKTLWRLLRERFPFVTLDLWVPALSEIAGADAMQGWQDLWVTEQSGSGDRSGRLLSLNSLRYEPYGLRGWTKAPHSAGILVAKCGLVNGGHAGADLLLSAIGDAVPSSSIDLDIFGGDDESSDTLESLRHRPTPSLIVAVGPDRRAANIWRSLALQAGAGYLHLSDDGFPMLLANGDGGPSLCASYGDVAKLLARLSESIPQERAHSTDTGWHTYWHLLSKR